MNIWLIFGVFMILSWIVSAVLKSKFKKYSKIPTDGGLTGRDVAEKMLRDNGIYDVRVECVQGQLTDHYNPDKKTINLSQDVYNSRSIAAAAVAAHETGHAVQHSKAYAWLGLRSKLVPPVSFASKWVQWVLLAGVILMNTFPALLFAVLYCLDLLPFSALLPCRLRLMQANGLLYGLKIQELLHR
jgi:Zn-dependent membrane protease YugP